MKKMIRKHKEIILRENIKAECMRLKLSEIANLLNINYYEVQNPDMYSINISIFNHPIFRY